MTDETRNADAASPGLAGIVASATLVQALASMALLTVPAVAPAAAASFGVSPAAVGYQISAVYLTATLSSLVGGTFVRRFGACRTSQIAMATTAFGVTVAAVFPHVAALLIGSLIVGMAYGLPNPSASHLLARRTPAKRRNLVFSIKQTGVPLGGAAAGLVAPWTATHFDWRAALLTVAAAALLAVLIEQPSRKKLDADRDPSVPLFRLPLGGLTLIRRRPALFRLALTAACFSGVQLCTMGFMVALLVEDLGFDLIAAGVILAVVQAGGVAGRILWGVLADWVGCGLTVLAALGALTAAGAVALMLLPVGAPVAVVAAVGLWMGATAVGWNGVFVAEVARLSPPGQVGPATGGAMSVTFAGVIVAPAAFALLHDVAGDYRRSCVLLVVVCLVGSVAALRARAASRAASRAEDAP